MLSSPGLPDARRHGSALRRAPRQSRGRPFPGSAAPARFAGLRPYLFSAAAIPGDHSNSIPIFRPPVNDIPRPKGSGPRRSRPLLTIGFAFLSLSLIVGNALGLRGPGTLGGKGQYDQRDDIRQQPVEVGVQAQLRQRVDAVAVDIQRGIARRDALKQTEQQRAAATFSGFQLPKIITASARKPKPATSPLAEQLAVVTA